MQKIVAATLGLLLALGVGSLPEQARGQSATYLNAPSPEKIAVTSGGVDIRTGRYAYSKTDLSIGEGAGAITFERIMATAIPGHVAPFGNLSHNWNITLVIKRSYNQYNSYDYLANVNFGGRSQTFERISDIDGLTPANYFRQKSQNDATRLTSPVAVGAIGAAYTFQATDGTLAVFRPMATGECTSISYDHTCAQVSHIIEPDGTRFDFEYETTPSATNRARLRSVASSRGYALLLEYNSVSSGWNHVTKACVLNLASTSKPANNVCPASALATTNYAYTGLDAKVVIASAAAPDLSTDSFTYTSTVPGVSYQMGFKKPGQTTPWLTNSLANQITQDGELEPVVGAQSFADGSGFTYWYDLTPPTNDPSGFSSSYQSVSGGSYRNTLGHSVEVRYDFPPTPYSFNPPRVYISGELQPPVPVNVGDIVFQVTSGPARVVDPLGRTTTSDYCDPNAMAGLPAGERSRCLVSMLQSTTNPDGSIIKAKYGWNNNITEIRHIAKPGSGLADIFETATYDGNACSNYLKTCNKPLTVTDAKGITTEYTWDAAHGGMLTETRAAPAPGADRPQKRFTWAQHYAWYRNAAGALVQSPHPVWLLAQTSECRSGTEPACIGTANETRTTISYGAPGSANNLLPVSKTIAAGDGSISATTSWTYDAFGNKLTEDGPLAGTADTTRTRYDIIRRVIGVVTPDPDGTGPLPHVATRNTYDPAGRLVKVEQGTVISQSDADWAAFIATKTVETTYDPLDRKLREWSYGTTGGTQSLTQYKYDLAGRLDCTAVRMNPAVYATISIDACTLGPQGTGAGDFGPDRITKLSYDPAGQVLKTTVAYGTPLQTDQETNTWSPSGKLATVTDGEGNRTTFEYDGHDRLKKTLFPVPAQGALTSSGADYEELFYDANSNIERRRKRDGSEIEFVYDDLGRNTVKVIPNRPDLALTNVRDIWSTYDLLGLQTSARFDSASGEGIVNSYDALGRMTASTSTMDGSTRTIASQYDLLGNRTRITHPDGVAFAYTYDPLSRLRQLHYYNAADPLTGAQMLFSSYNPDGSRLATGRYSVTSGYEYDPVGRLKKHSFVTYDNGTPVETNRWTYAYTPSSQLASVVRTKDTFAWTAHVNADRNYTTNGLNQYTAAGPAQFCYDKNGNLTADGASVYRYDVENRLVEKRVQGAANADCNALSYAGALEASLRYDPIGRLYETWGPAQGLTRRVHDGDALTLEYGASGTVLRRHVHGPDGKADDPLYWFEGNQPAWLAQRQLVADHQGSVVATVAANGTLFSINRYDEYGIPQNTNQGRFGYTGQAWLPELGMWYYKARIYSPTLGRFLQTDPIGYKDGVNWYDYVHGDPVNAVDPDGQKGVAILVDFALEVGIQYATTGKVDLKQAVIETAKGAINPLKTVQKLAQAARLAERALKKACCFVAGTVILTDAGAKRIEDIRIGDKVWSEDRNTKQMGWRPVTKLYVNTSDTVWELRIRTPRGQELHRVTASHPYWVMSAGWIEVGSLSPGMALITNAGEAVFIESVRDTGKVEQTFNLEVDDLHSFFVGDTPVLVHNGCYGGMTRKQAYGNPSGSPAARQARGAGEGQPCSNCGNTQSSGTPTSPQAQHDPALSDHYNSGAGKNMTPEQRREYARSPESLDGSRCATCQRSEGGKKRQEHDDKR